MTVKNPPFTLSLSTGELGWLAGVFSLSRLGLPIPIPPPSDESLRAAQESLASRGLMRRDPGVGWQIDQLAAFLVQWLGAVEQYTCLEILHREGDSRRAGLYARQGLFLLADCTDVQVNFAFLPDADALSAALATCLGAGAVYPGDGEYTLPQPGVLIRTAWQDEATARRLLEKCDLSKKEITSTLKWIQSLTTVTACLPVPHVYNESFLLCSSGSGMWLDVSGKFIPSSWEDAARRVRNLLENQAGE